MEQSKEIWLDIDDYKGYYQVSNLGRVKSVERKASTGIEHLPFRTIKSKLLKPILKKGGYYAVHLSKMNKLKMLSIHRLVATAFLPNISHKPLINHKDGIKTNNNIENLEWVTHSENMIHAVIHGLSRDSSGENSSVNKLTNSDVYKIRQMHDSTGMTQKEISRLFNVDASTISVIVNYKSWVHLR